MNKNYIFSLQELKIRLEREKETSFKELQKQSIEYQKKLQEQLQESVQKVNSCDKIRFYSSLVHKQNQFECLYHSSILTLV